MMNELPMKIKLTAKGQSGTRTAASKLKDQSVARGANFRRRHIVIPSLISFTMHSVQARICLTVQAVAARIGAAFAQCFVPGIPRRAREREKTGILVFFRERTGALRRRNKSEFVLHTRVQERKKKVTLLLPKKKKKKKKSGMFHYRGIRTC
ncbi:PREDICTED: uncharacterized protein LOC108493986 isoform X3 [Lepidothrix coronata]|uniref:Uncharacterized protein LOC108493986 isoform X3 n=1 Tax=Lepidothrix coronata TaxID=321398 RepID=A0A6J0GNK5_9PASS|nr:PREDICTED: uncharacterized protein LOC108493986 isoform X3 [Lepidothrix coronata]